MGPATNQPEIAPGVPGMNAHDLVNAPLGPEAEAAVARSQAERFQPDKCFKCLATRKEYDESIRLYEPFIGAKTAKVLHLGERPDVNTAKYRVHFWSMFEFGHGDTKDVCESCVDAFAKEMTDEYDGRCAGLKGWHDAQTIDRMLIVPVPNKAGVLTAGEASDSREHYDVSLGGKWVHDSKYSPTRYPKKK